MKTAALQSRSGLLVLFCLFSSILATGLAQEADELLATLGGYELEEPSFADRLVAFLGKFHVVVIHFPIALILVGLLAEALALAVGPSFEQAARFLVWLAVPAALVAAVLGWLHAAASPGVFDETILFRHRWLGVSTAVAITAAAVLRETAGRGSRAPLRWAYRILLAAAAVLVGMAGHLGGTLVFGPDYYSW